MIFFFLFSNKILKLLNFKKKYVMINTNERKSTSSRKTTYSKKSNSLLLLLMLFLPLYFLVKLSYSDDLETSVSNEFKHEVSDIVKNQDFYNIELTNRNLNSEDESSNKSYVYAAYSLRDKWVTSGVNGYIILPYNENSSNYVEEFKIENGFKYNIKENDLIKYGVATAQDQNNCGCNNERDFQYSINRRYSNDKMFLNEHRFECIGLYSKTKAHGVESYFKIIYFDYHADNKRRYAKNRHKLIHPPKR